MCKDIGLIVCLLFLCASLAQFGCLAWSPCEKKLLYVAEKKRVEPSAQSSFVSASEDGGLVLLEEQVRSTELIPHVALCSKCYN